jgi:hypothetical protein
MADRSRDGFKREANGQCCCTLPMTVRLTWALRV